MIGDSRYLPLKDKSVNCIITSPPYWSLRKYDIPDLIWDGDEGCEHNFNLSTIEIPTGTGGNWQQANNGPGLAIGKDQTRFKGDCREANKVETVKIQQGFCLHCSAWRGQLGLEPTIDLYLKHLLQIMDECKRVLRDDGVMFVNMGDSYAGSGKGIGTDRTKCKEVYTDDDICKTDWSNTGIPTKSLCLIPYRFAIAMVDRGWILRNFLIWHKPNCMPSSAKDRFTVDFEPVFFFVKSKKYWFEQQLEPLKQVSIARYDRGYSEDGKYVDMQALNKPRKNRKYDDTNLGSDGTGLRNHSGNSLTKLEGRNRRCVWTIPTAAYSEAHFATFPEALVEPMIKAGCPQFVCKKCGKAREKILSVQYTEAGKNNNSLKRKGNSSGQDVGCRPYDVRKLKTVNEIGLTDCGCNAEFESGIVLDPFSGSGTVIKVAESLQGRAIGIDLGYQELQEKRRKWNQVEMII